jgi:hypothetical protein
VRSSVRYTLMPVPSEYVLGDMRFVLFRAPDEEGALDFYEFARHLVASRRN